MVVIPCSFARFPLSGLMLLWALGEVQARPLTVYSSADADVLKVYAEQFARDIPKIKIDWVRDSTGIMQARLLKEKDARRADVVFAHTAANMVSLGQAGILMPYAPKGLERLNGKYLEKRSPPLWVGLYGWASAICYNTVAGQKAGVPKPLKWADLVSPEFKDRVVMPSPATSGTGLLLVNGWVQMWGEEKAWAYMDKLHANITSYTQSGAKPCDMAGAGKAVVGLSLPARGASVKAKGAPVETIIAEEGTGWDLQAAGIVKGTDQLADARIFMDWTVSQAAMEAYGRNAEVTALKVRVQKMAHLPANIPEKMVKVDFDWNARESPRVVAEWLRRYGGKVEARN